LLDPIENLLDPDLVDLLHLSILTSEVNLI
jgi:hypothetical protein